MQSTKAVSLDSLPRFRIATLFILFACAAIGLATSRDVRGAMGPAIAAAMVVGLLQQARVVRRWRLTTQDLLADGRFAISFAVFWRIVVTAALAFYVFASLVGIDNGLLYPDRDDLFFYEPATAIYQLLPILVLANSCRRWTSADVRVAPGISRWLLLVLIGILLTAFAVVDGRLTEYLVHRAVAGIDASIRLGFQRPGLYPDHSQEWFCSFWLSCAAATSVAIGALSLVIISNQRSLTGRRYFFAAFIVCVAVQPLYCGWFYCVEFHRISPDLAGAGLAAVPHDWLTSALLIATGTTTIAYCLSSQSHERMNLSTDLANDLEQTAFHETTPCLVLIAISAALDLSSLLMQLVGDVLFPVMRAPHPWMELWLNVGMFCSPTALFIYAQTLLVFQLCYLRWSRRRQEVPWELPVLPARLFVANWLAVALAILVGVPTLGAFGFLFWLGPFNFVGI